MGKIVVTGGTGFLGRNLIRYILSNTDDEVYAVVRPDSKNLSLLPQSPRVHTVLTRLEDVEKNICDLPEKCDAFYHFAWGGVNREELDDPKIHEANVSQAMCCVRAASALGCSAFVDAGSRAEYGLLEGPFREDAACSPKVAYGWAKLKFSDQAKAYLRGSQTRFIHARIFSVYGADDHPWSLIYTCVTRMLANEPIDLGPCTHYWNFMEVTDTCDLLYTFYKLRDRIPPDDSGIFNVATRDIRPLKEFVQEIRELTRSESELRFGAFKPGKDSTYSILPDMDKVERTFGWRQKVSFSAGITKMIDTLGGTK